MFVTVGMFLAGLFGREVKDGVARALGIGALVLALIAAALIWLAIHDHNVIKNHDARQDAKISDAIVTADRHADDAQDQRESDFGNSQGEIGNAVTNAIAADPGAARRPVGPASQSYYDTLRRQQEAKGKSE